MPASTLLAPLLRRQRHVKRSPLLPVAPSAKTAFSAALPWLLSSLLLTLLPLTGQVPTWTLLLFGGCTVWRFVLEKRGKPLPSLPVRVLLFLPVAYLILRTYGSRPSASGMLAFLIALLSLKVLELRTTRDFTVAALLGYFMVLSALFYNQSLVICGYLTLIVLLNSAALVRCHGGLRGTWPTLRLSLGMGLQALPLVVLLFVVFPRVQGTFFKHFGGGTTGQTGMSERLQPGSFSALAQSSDTAFHARIKSGQPITQGQLYWRGLVLDLCDQAMSWRASPQTLGNPITERPAHPGGIEQTIDLVHTGERWLFALDRPTGMVPSANLRAEYVRTQTLRSRDPIDQNVIYTVFSTEKFTDPPTMEDIRRKFYTHLPSDENPRAMALAASWRRNARTDDDVIRAASQFFMANRFIYTLAPGLLPHKGALDYFLFTSHQGFCEHYAAAFSTLMRAAGIPARIVVGYQGGEFNKWGLHYTVRQSDAHAWSEVWLNGRGWVREDPTGFVAPDRVSYGAENYASLAGVLTDEMRLDRLNALNAPGPWRWLLHNTSQLWDDVDEQWNLLVLGYDQDAQLTVMEKLGLSSLDWLGGTALTLAIAFIILAAGAGVIQLLNRRSRSGRDPLLRLYERFCRKIAARAGLQRETAEGPLDFARRASAALPDSAADIQRVTDLYVASRYARDGGKGVAEALRAAVASFRLSPARAPETS